MSEPNWIDGALTVPSGKSELPAVMLSAVFVVPPDAVRVRATFVLLVRFVRVLENVAAVEVVDEPLLAPARDTFNAIGLVALVVPVT